MNKAKINELYEKAYVTYEVPYESSVVDPTIVSIHKQRVWDRHLFAELIVKECIDKITTYDLVPGHSAKWEDIYDIHTRLLQDLGEELKEHFGVTK